MAQIEGGDIHYEESGVRCGAGDAAAAEWRAGRRAPVPRPVGGTLPDGPYDQRGTGRSAPVAVPEGMTMGGRAAEFAELFDALGIDRAHLFCHSTGCGIGLSLSADCPDRVAGLFWSIRGAMAMRI